MDTLKLQSSPLYITVLPYCSAADLERRNPARRHTNILLYIPPISSPLAVFPLSSGLRRSDPVYANATAAGNRHYPRHNPPPITPVKKPSDKRPLEFCNAFWLRN